MKIIKIQSFPIYFDICSVHLATWRTIKSLSISQILLSLSLFLNPRSQIFLSFIPHLRSRSDHFVLPCLSPSKSVQWCYFEDLGMWRYIFIAASVSAFVSAQDNVFSTVLPLFLVFSFLSSFFSPFLDPQSLEIVLGFLLFSLQWRTSNPKKSIEIDWQMIRCTCSRRCLFMVLCEKYFWCESVYV